MNRYKETAREVMTILNAKPSRKGYTNYSVELIVDGVQIKPEDIDDQKNFVLNLVSLDTRSLEFKFGDFGWVGVQLSHDTLIEYSVKEGSCIFGGQDKFTSDLDETTKTIKWVAKLSKIKEKTFDYGSLF